MKGSDFVSNVPDQRVAKLNPAVVVQGHEVAKAANRTNPGAGFDIGNDRARVLDQKPVPRTARRRSSWRSLGRKPVDAGRDQPFHRVGQRIDIAPRFQGPQQFDQEQRVPGGSLGEGRDLAGEQRMVAGGGVDEVLGLVWVSGCSSIEATWLDSGETKPASPGRRVRRNIQGWRSSPTERPARSSREASSIQWVSSITIRVRAVTTASSKAPTAARVRAGRNWSSSWTTSGEGWISTLITTPINASQGIRTGRRFLDPVRQLFDQSPSGPSPSRSRAWRRRARNGK